MVEKQYKLLLKRIAKNVKKYRAKAKLTQEDMQSYGFNYRFYQKIESGNYSISLHTLLRLAVVFKVDISDLIRK